MSGEIFISYRRQESKWSTKSVYDRLSASFGSKRIFMDIDAIALGDDFVKAIEKTVSQCDVLIAVIGAHWLTATDDQGRRRLENPEDLVRRELAAALKRDIRVIPVLVDGALMPQPTELPDELKPLIRRNALRISDTGFEDDCRRLVAAIGEVLEKTSAERHQREEQERPQSVPRPPVATPPALGKSDEPKPPKRLRTKETLFGVLLLVVGSMAWFSVSHCNSLNGNKTAKPPSPPTNPGQSTTNQSTAHDRTTPSASGDDTLGLGLRCEILEVKHVSGDALLIRWRLIGSQLRSVVYDATLGEEIYYIDTTQNRKYSVLQLNNTPIAALITYKQIQPGQQRIAWAKFPAPPPATKKISIYIQNFLPFEDIPVD
jgi:hypothetical protein